MGWLEGAEPLEVEARIILSWEGGRGMSPPGSVPTYPPCLVPTPRQSALSRALLQPNAWAAATVARVAGPGLIKPVGTDLKGAESPGTFRMDVWLQLTVSRGGEGREARGPFSEPRHTKGYWFQLVFSYFPYGTF